MKWKRKYSVNLQEVHEKNLAGASLVDLSKEYGIPRTTLNRYLLDAGFSITVNRKIQLNTGQLEHTKEKCISVVAHGKEHLFYDINTGAQYVDIIK